MYPAALFERLPCANDELVRLFDKHSKALEVGHGPRVCAALSRLGEVAGYWRVDGDDVVLVPELVPVVQGDVLQELKPWRKGPWSYPGLRVESEWNSGLKWRRVLDAGLGDLRGKTLLDIGSGNGYFLFRALEAGASAVLGVDPSPLVWSQFEMARRYGNEERAGLLALGLEDLSGIPMGFDVVMCMGVLYHRRSPLDLLDQLRAWMKVGGELVLETLVLPGEGELCLTPYPTYAKMRNCFFLPTVATLRTWLERTGFRDIRIDKAVPTTLDEQRKTEWVNTQSLGDFLDAQDPTRTVEGYPAPTRVIAIARSYR